MSNQSGATGSTVSTSTTETITETTATNEAPTLKLRCHKPKNKKKVNWTETTVDNEHANKRKSKCCCVYVKAKEFGESSSESDGECEHCTGHVDKNKST